MSIFRPVIGQLPLIPIKEFYIREKNFDFVIYVCSLIYNLLIPISHWLKMTSKPSFPASWWSLPMHRRYLLIEGWLIGWINNFLACDWSVATDSVLWLVKNPNLSRSSGLSRFRITLPSTLTRHTYNVIDF